MYIAGRLRTASMPPRTLMDVASYLCPPFPPAVSFSAMDRASPQTAGSYELEIFKRLGDTREGGRADVSTLAHIWRARLAHWPQLPKIPARTFCPKRICACETRRVAASSRPVPNFGGDAAKLFIFLSEEESSIAGLALLALARARNWSECGSDSAVQEESRTTKFYRKMAFFTR